LSDLFAEGISQHFIHTPVAAHDDSVFEQDNTGTRRIEQRVPLVYRGIQFGGSYLDQLLKVFTMTFKFIGIAFFSVMSSLIAR
jgi:hypothetical protein